MTKPIFKFQFPDILVENNQKFRDLRDAFQSLNNFYTSRTFDLYRLLDIDNLSLKPDILFELASFLDLPKVLYYDAGDIQFLLNKYHAFFKRKGTTVFFDLLYGFVLKVGVKKLLRNNLLAEDRDAANEIFTFLDRSKLTLDFNIFNLINPVTVIYTLYGPSIRSSYDNFTSQLQAIGRLSEELVDIMVAYNSDTDTDIDIEGYALNRQNVLNELYRNATELPKMLFPTTHPTLETFKTEIGSDELNSREDIDDVKKLFRYIYLNLRNRFLTDIQRADFDSLVTNRFFEFVYATYDTYSTEGVTDDESTNKFYRFDVNVYSQQFFNKVKELLAKYPDTVRNRLEENIKNYINGQNNALHDDLTELNRDKRFRFIFFDININVIEVT